MPNKIDDFLAWRIVYFCYRQLQKIRVANGFNTDPSVTMNAAEYRASTSKYALLLEVSDHGAEEHGVGGELGTPRVYQVLSMEVSASIALQGGIPRKEAMRLEQDVRTAIHSGLTDMKSTIGKQAVFEFGDCPHDAGELTPEKEAGFRLSIRFGYPQGKTW